MAKTKLQRTTELKAKLKAVVKRLLDAGYIGDEIADALQARVEELRR
jgi:hypothetical protein